ncbi:phosphoglycerate mutase family protein, partial [Cystoisospora suis]
GESLEDVRERAVVFFVEALVGEFLLSVDLRDFVAEAAADERRAVAVANRLAPSPDNAGVPGSSRSPAQLSEPSLPCANNVEAQEGVSNSKLGPSNHTTSPAQALFSLQSEREDTKAYPRQQRAFGDGIAEMSNDVKDAVSSGVGTEQEMNRRHLVAQSDLAVDDPARQEREMRLDKWIGRPAKVLAGSDEMTDSSLSFLSPSVNLVFGGTLDVAVEAPSAASTAVATDAKTRGFASLFSLDVTGSDCSSSSASAEERNPSLESDSSPRRATESNGVGVSHRPPASQVSDPVSMRASAVEECEADWHCQSEHVTLANIEMSVASADDDENDGDVTTVSSPSARGSYTLVKPTIQGASVSPILSAPGPVHKGQTSVLPENHPLREAADSHSNDSLQSSPTTHSTAALFSVTSVSGPVTDGLQELHAPGTGSHTHVTSSYDAPLPAGFSASFSEAASEDGVREGGAAPAGGRRPKRRRRRKGKSQTGGDVDDDGGPRDAAGQNATTRKKSGSWFPPAVGEMQVTQRSGGVQTEAAREASHTADHLEEMEFASVASCGASTVYQDGVAMADEAEDDPGRARCCVGPVVQMPFSDGEAEPNTRYHGATSPGTRSDCDGEKVYSTARRKRRGASAVGTCLRSGWSAAQARSEGTGTCLRYSKAQLPHPQPSLSFDAKVTSDSGWLRLKSSSGFCREEEYWSLFAHSRFGQGEEEDEVVQSLRRSQQARKRVEIGGPLSPVTSSDGENKHSRNCYPTGDACHRAQTDNLCRPSVQVKDLRLPFTLCKLPDKTSGSFLSAERRAEFTKFIFFENSPDRLPLTEEETGVDQGSTSCMTKSSGPAASSGTDKQSEHQQSQGQEMLVTSQVTDTESRKPEPKMGILCRSAHETPEEYGSVGVRSSAAGVCDSVRTPTSKQRNWVWPALQEGERVQRERRRSGPCGSTLPHRAGHGTACELGGGSHVRLMTNTKVRGGHMEIDCVGAEASLLDACEHTEGRVGGRTAEPEDQGSCHPEWRMNGDASSDDGRASLSNRERRGIPGEKRDHPLVLHNRRRSFSWSAGGQGFTEVSWSCSTRVPPETHSVTFTVTLSATNRGPPQAPSEDPAFWTSLSFPQGVRTPSCTSELRAQSNAAASTNRKHRSRAASADAIMGSHVIALFSETQARDPDVTQLEDEAADSPQIQLLSHRRCRAELVTENVRRLFSSRKRHHRSVQPGHGRTEGGPQEMPCPSGDGSLKLPVIFAGLLHLVSGFARTCMPVAGAPARRADEGLSECTGSRSTVAAESCQHFAGLRAQPCLQVQDSQLLLPQGGHATGERERLPPAVVQSGDESLQENARNSFAAPASCTLPDTAMLANPSVNPLCMWSLGLLRVLGKKCKEWSESCVTSLLGRPRKSKHTQKTQTSDGLSVMGSRVSVMTDTGENHAASAHCGALTDPARCLTERGEGAVAESVKDGPASSSLGGRSEETHPPVRGRVLHLMKKTVTQCVAATLQNVHGRDVAAVTGDARGPGTPAPVLGMADESYSRAEGGQDKQPMQGERSAGSVLVITHECVIRELLQALCGRRFGNTIKAGSITVLDVYTRRSGNESLRTSIPSRNTKAWSWLTGYASESEVREGSDQEEKKTSVEMTVEESDLDVDIEPSELHVLGLPYKSAQLFASDERVEAVDALLSRVNCRVEVFNKRE